MNSKFILIKQFLDISYFGLTELLSLKSLKAWEDEHYDHNQVCIDEIEGLYIELQSETVKAVRRVHINYMIEMVESLELFDLNEEVTKGLNDLSLSKLNEYNMTIRDFKINFNTIKDTLK